MSEFYVDSIFLLRFLKTLRLPSANPSFQPQKRRSKPEIIKYVDHIKNRAGVKVKTSVSFHTDLHKQDDKAQNMNRCVV